jgi:hypothetical protein
MLDGPMDFEVEAYDKGEAADMAMGTAAEEEVRARGHHGTAQHTDVHTHTHTPLQVHAHEALG